VEKMPDGSIRFESMQRWKAGNLFKGKVHHPWPIPKLGPR
jgi:hypothetical protein